MRKARVFQALLYVVVLGCPLTADPQNGVLMGVPDAGEASNTPRCSRKKSSKMRSRKTSSTSLRRVVGLHLLIKPNGSRLWRLKCGVDGREKLLSFGMYPEVSLKLARERRDEARLIIRRAIDPAAQRKAEKVADAETFEAVAREWFEKFALSWAESHSSKVIRGWRWRVLC